MRGSYMEPITPEMKDRFLDLIANGYTREEAAKALEQTGRRFRAICSPKSPFYDEAFAEEYEMLTQKGGEHEQGIIDRLRSAGLQRAERSSDRLLEKYSVIYDPDWHVHRPQAPQLNINNNRLELVLQELSTEELQQAKLALERKRQGELPPAHPDIDQ